MVLFEAYFLQSKKTELKKWVSMSYRSEDNFGNIFSKIRIFSSIYNFFCQHISPCSNEMVFNWKVITHDEVFDKAKLDNTEWLDKTIINSPVLQSATHQTTCRQSKWTNPRSGWIKCNYDSSHHEENRNSGRGWILWNESGIVNHCGMGKFQRRNTTTLIWVSQSSWWLGYMRVEFEDDNFNIYRIINDDIDKRRLQNYIETVHLWKAIFKDIKFTYKPRQ